MPRPPPAPATGLLNRNQPVLTRVPMVIRCLARSSLRRRRHTPLYSRKATPRCWCTAKTMSRSPAPKTTRAMCCKWTTSACMRRTRLRDDAVKACALPRRAVVPSAASNQIESQHIIAAGVRRAVFR